MEHVLNCTGYELLVDDIQKAEGCYLYDSKGKRYIDFESGVWSISLGHSHEDLNEKIKDQLDKIVHFGFRYSSQLVETAAKDVIDTLSPFRGKCVFLCSGSEAVELAVKAAKYIIKDKLVLTFNFSYLSAYGQSGARDDKEWHKLSLDKCVYCSNNTECSKCEAIKKIPFDRIGAFVFEPGSSSGLVLLPPKSVIQEIVKRIKANNGLIVVDEVTTGIGRTGMWYGYQNYEIQPDIVAIGKGIGNGYPISAVAFADEIAELVQKGGFKHSQSHQNDALGSVVVSKVIDIIKDNDLISKSRKTGEYLLNSLRRLMAGTNVIKEVRGIGMMIGVEFYPEAADVLAGLAEHLHEKGILA
ncbi:MAG: aspartate aminotransferase family protein, partial [Clostridia bacterium]|nr:aspartate aminotransferase family protein [Clostridia bacterium]